MRIPSFDENGQVYMSTVLNATPKDYEEFGLNVVGLLEELQQRLAAVDAQTYSKSKSDIVHNYLNQHQTQESQSRKPGYQLPVLYCFYYTLYGLLFNCSSYYHMDESDIQIMDREIIDCEIQLVKNPFAFYGRSNKKFIESFKLQRVTIPKGCAIKANGKTTTSKKQYNVLVNHICHGYYNNGVHHPSFRWSGKNGWNEALFKDVFQDVITDVFFKCKQAAL